VAKRLNLSLITFDIPMQNVALNTALKEEVIITRRDGSKFKLISVNENKDQYYNG
jgi:hypothetical protein